MVQLTIRGFDEDLERRIRALAEAEGISLNQAVLRLLRRGAGIESGRKRNVVGNGLDDLAGTWTGAQEREFLEAVRPFEAIDENLWR